MHVRQGVEFVGSSLIIEGLGSDNQSPSLLAAEFRAQAAKTPTSSDAKSCDRPSYAAHYLVFYFTSNDRSIKNIVARYVLSNVTASWLADKFIEIVSRLAVAGFMVTMVTPDGASENRSFCRLIFKLLTSKMTIVLPGGTIEELPDAICQMIHPCDDEYIITFVSDWVHWVKKLRNAQIPAAARKESVPPAKKAKKSPRSLKIGEWRLDLMMAKRAYEGVGGCEGGGARFHFFTALHFEPDNWAKMRFFLAAQVLSQSMCRVILEYCENQDKRKGGPTEQEYRGYLDLCKNCDLLVDIFNGTELSKRTGEKKGGKRIMKNVATDVESQAIVEKMKGILLFFDTWRKGCKDLEADFITNESWEDLRTLICGNIDHLVFYSKKFGDDFTWDFRSGGSDVCELHFANQRAEGDGGAVTARQAKRACDRSLTTRLVAVPGANAQPQDGPAKKSKIKKKWRS